MRSDKIKTKMLMDAWPAKGFFELIILNLHYPDYYRGTALPKGDQNPSPNIFLSARKDIIFRFCVMPFSKCKKSDNVKRVIGILNGIVKVFGVGAKTDSSYSCFA